MAELWLVDTSSSSVLVYRRSGPQAAGFDVALELQVGDRLTSPLLDGFGLDLDDFFQP